MLTALRERERAQIGRDPTRSAAIVDRQSVRASERGGLHGYDGGTKVSGIKRHLLVDTRGTVLVACVSPASVGERDGAAVRHHRRGRAAPLRRIPLDLGEGRDTARGSAPLRGGPAALGGGADVKPPGWDGAVVCRRTTRTCVCVRVTPSTSPWPCSSCVASHDQPADWAFQTPSTG
ncbi:transposase [Streptomyces sp. NPDC001617]